MRWTLLGCKSRVVVHLSYRGAVKNSCRYGMDALRVKNSELFIPHLLRAVKNDFFAHDLSFARRYVPSQILGSLRGMLRGQEFILLVTPIGAPSAYRYNAPEAWYILLVSGRGGKYTSPSLYHAKP